MAKKEKGPPLVDAGVFLIDKPVGPSSFFIIRQMRRALNMQKVGHAGTLDPFASGLLVVCAGRKATRLIPWLMAGDKEYEAVLTLGAETDTGDPEGVVVSSAAVPELDRDAITALLGRFTGVLQQRPPSFSAVKHQGRPLYAYAREGIFIEKEPRAVVIHRLQYVDYQTPQLTVKVTCSKGTYIRALAVDIGRALGCGAHLSVLRRTRSGFFSIDNSLPGSILSDVIQARECLTAAVLSCAAVTEMIQLPENDNDYMSVKEVDSGTGS